MRYGKGRMFADLTLTFEVEILFSIDPWLRKKAYAL